VIVDIEAAAELLRQMCGGYEVVHSSPGLEVGVYVLIAPEPDLQTPHTFDEVYHVLSGSADIEIDGIHHPISAGQAVVVAASVDHRFHGYDELVLLVVFNGPESEVESA
jgi:mannose-6-phosphate isomerase-like protein (cupin superfamily)